MNRQTLRQGRHDAWVALCTLIQQYAYRIQRGEVSRGLELREVIMHFPFSSVFWHLVHLVELPGASEILPVEVRTALANFPEILAW